MATANHLQFGLAARDLRAMRGKDPGVAARDVARRTHDLERVLGYMVPIPREIVVQTGDRFTPVPFDKTGRLYLYSSDELVGVESYTGFGYRRAS